MEQWSKYVALHCKLLQADVSSPEERWLPHLHLGKIKGEEERRRRRGMLDFLLCEYIFQGFGRVTCERRTRARREREARLFSTLLTLRSWVVHPLVFILLRTPGMLAEARPAAPLEKIWAQGWLLSPHLDFQGCTELLSCCLPSPALTEELLGVTPNPPSVLTWSSLVHKALCWRPEQINSPNMTSEGRWSRGINGKIPIFRDSGTKHHQLWGRGLDLAGERLREQGKPPPHWERGTQFLTLSSIREPSKVKMTAILQSI